MHNLREEQKSVGTREEFLTGVMNADERGVTYLPYF